MPCSRRWLSVIVAILLFTIPVLPSGKSAQEDGSPPFAKTARKGGPPATVLPAGALSQRVVAYKIDAHLEVTKKAIDATEILTYRNLTGQPLQEFPFHLYLNAFQPKASFMRESHRDSPMYPWDYKASGAIEIKKFEVAGMGDLTKELKFIQPDDNNPDDRTVVQVRLPKPVPPGAEVQFTIAFHDKLPEVLARTGYKDDFFMGAQWFPKVGVFWHGAWNCHQFHRNTEFFADFGKYDVKLTLPQKYVVGAGGDLASTVKNADGTKTVAWHGEDIHDFVWTADPNYTVYEDVFNGSAGKVKIIALIEPTHRDQARRYIDALKGTLDRFDRWYGPYPYDRITLVDPHSLSAGGMEYPTLFTADTVWRFPRGLRFPEMVTEHEFGHQYWYGMVATNEFEEAWLDEGINSYTEVKILDSLYGQDTSMMDMLGGTMGDRRMQWQGMSANADNDPLVRHAWQFMNGGSYGAVTYGKTACVLLTLEDLIGEDTLRNALHTYFMRYRFTHPTKEDFLKTVEEVSGQDLRWYFDQAVDGTQVLDYEVKDVRSGREDWFETFPAKAGKDTLYRNLVLVHRKGDFIYPLTVEIKFDNGEKIREKWDGRDRWVRYTYDKNARVISAEIDPDHKVWLDRDLLNNSRRAQPDATARHKLVVYSTLVWQFISQALAWLA